MKLIDARALHPQLSLNNLKFKFYSNKIKNHAMRMAHIGGAIRIHEISDAQHDHLELTTNHDHNIHSSGQKIIIDKKCFRTTLKK